MWFGVYRARTACSAIIYQPAVYQFVNSTTVFSWWHLAWFAVLPGDLLRPKFSSMRSLSLIVSIVRSPASPTRFCLCVPLFFGSFGSSAMLFWAFQVIWTAPFEAELSFSSKPTNQLSTSSGFLVDCIIIYSASHTASNDTSNAQSDRRMTFTHKSVCVTPVILKSIG